MANNVSAFFETLTAAAGAYNAAKVSNLQFLEGVYLDVQPDVAREGKTLNVYFPDLGAWTDQGSTDWNPDDINPNFIQLTFNSRPGKGILVRDFDQWQTSNAIIETFLDPMFKRGLEYFNGAIAGLINTTNFNVYTPVQALNPVEIGVRDASRAWKALAGNKVPVADRANMSLLTHSDVHAEMLNDAAWTQESMVGIMIAQTARQEANLGVAFNFNKRWDQQSPSKVYTLTGTNITATNGSTAVTGTGTAFNTQCAAYDNITFAADPSQTPYRILSVNSATSITLTANFTGATITASTAMGVGSNYTNIAMHKYAIALAVRPLPLVNDGNTQSRIVMLKGIPFRVQSSYEHLKGGYLLTMDCGFAAGVMRPDFGVIVKS